MPLTLAIIEGLSVDVGGDTYIVPLHAVRECVTLPVEERGKGACGVIDLRGEPLPYIRLRHCFAIDRPPPTRENIVVVIGDGVKAGLAVDALYGSRRTVIKALGKQFQHVPGISGSAILGNGRVALIVDVAGLLRDLMKSAASDRSSAAMLLIHFDPGAQGVEGERAMLQNTRITKRIALGFGMIVGLMLVLAAAGYWALQAVEQRMARVIQQNARVAEYSASVLIKAITLRRYEKDTFLSIGKSDKVEESFTNWSDARSQLEQSITNLDEYVTRSEEKLATERMRSELSKYQEGLFRTVERIRSHALKTPQEADHAMEEVKAGIQGLEKLVEDLGRANNEKLQAASYEAANVLIRN